MSTKNLKAADEANRAMFDAMKAANEARSAVVTIEAKLVTARAEEERLAKDFLSDDKAIRAASAAIRETEDELRVAKYRAEAAEARRFDAIRADNAARLMVQADLTRRAVSAVEGAADAAEAALAAAEEAVRKYIRTTTDFIGVTGDPTPQRDRLHALRIVVLGAFPSLELPELFDEKDSVLFPGMIPSHGARVPRVSMYSALANNRSALEERIIHAEGELDRILRETPNAEQINPELIRRKRKAVDDAREAMNNFRSSEDAMLRGAA